MKTKRVMVAVAAALMLVTTASLSPAHAAVLTYGGTLPPGGTPTMPVVFITTPTCTGQGTTPVTYREYPIIATDDGLTTFSVNEISGATSIYLMEFGWNPAAAFPNCLAGANGSNPTLTYAVTSGTAYVVVVFDDGFDQPGTTYELTIDGPVAGPPTRPIRPGGLDDLVDATTSTTVTTTTAPSTTTTALPTTTAPPTVPTTVMPTTTRPVTPTSARAGGTGQAPAARPIAARAGYTG